MSDTGFHMVPDAGMNAWSTPDPATPSIRLDGGQRIEVVERRGDWAHIRSAAGSTAWVDGRLLLVAPAPAAPPIPPLPAPPPAPPTQVPPAPTFSGSETVAVLPGQLRPQTPSSPGAGPAPGARPGYGSIVPPPGAPLAPPLPPGANPTDCFPAPGYSPAPPPGAFASSGGQGSSPTVGVVLGVVAAFLAVTAFLSWIKFGGETNSGWTLANDANDDFGVLEGRTKLGAYLLQAVYPMVIVAAVAAVLHVLRQSAAKAVGTIAAVLGGVAVVGRLILETGEGVSNGVGVWIAMIASVVLFVGSLATSNP